MRKKHYTEKDFIKTHESEIKNNFGVQKGYCNICHSDMQRFWENNKWGILLHYKSHQYYKQFQIDKKRGYSVEIS